MTEPPAAAAAAAASGGGGQPGASAAFKNIRAFGRNEPGQFKMTETIFGWRRAGAEKHVHTYKPNEVEKVEIMRTSRDSWQLKLSMTTGDVNRFDGFKESDAEKLANHFREYFKIDPKIVRIGTRGWHWGNYTFEGKNFIFDVDGKPAFDLHAADMAQVTNPSKNDIAIEFHQDDSRDQLDDQLLEVRFYIPPRAIEAAGEARDIATELRNVLVEKAGVSTTGLQPVASLADVPFLVPRGKYDIDLFKTSMKLHGKSFDYTVRYKTINRFFLLPRADGIHVAVIIALDVPMRQGQTRYPFVVMNFPSDHTITLDVNLTDEELNSDRFAKQKLEANMTGRMYDVLTRLVKGLTEKPAIMPSQKFKSAISDTSCIACSNKAAAGHLYPLQRGFIFIPKPVIYIRYEDVLSVEFSRTVGSQTKYFEFKVYVKGGDEHLFSSVDRHEYTALVAFIQNEAKLNIKNLQQTKESKAKDNADVFAGDLPSDEDDDEDYEDMDDGQSVDGLREARRLPPHIGPYVKTRHNTGHDNTHIYGVTLLLSAEDSEDEEYADEDDDDDDDEERPKKKHKSSGGDDKKEKKKKDKKEKKKKHKDKHKDKVGSSASQSVRWSLLPPAHAC